MTTCLAMQRVCFWSNKAMVLVHIIYQSLKQQLIYQKSNLKLLMSFDQGLANKKDNAKCSECLIFYASEAFGGLCSSCFKSSQHLKKEEKVETLPSCPSTPLSTAEVELQEAIEQLSLQPVKKQQADRKRCFDCNKKVGLLGIECKCSFVFCNAHRLPQNHACGFDHREKGKEKLKGEIIKVAKSKITEI